MQLEWWEGVDHGGKKSEDGLLRPTICVFRKDWVRLAALGPTLWMLRRKNKKSKL